MVVLQLQLCFGRPPSWCGYCTSSLGSSCLVIKPHTRSPHHHVLALVGELAGEEAGEVALDEAKHQHVTQGGQGDDEDDDKGHKGEDVTCGAAQGGDLTRLQRATQDSLGEQAAWREGAQHRERGQRKQRTMIIIIGQVGLMRAGE